MGCISTERADILARLQKDILPLQGYKPLPSGSMSGISLGPADAAFPQGCFPTGAIHEFQAASTEQLATSTGFISALLSNLMHNDGACIWVSKSQTIFPPALKSFGIAPERIVFVHTDRTNDLLWVMEEALKCNGLAAVVGEIAELGFTASRRLQLAVEQSNVTGLLLRQHTKPLKPIAAVCRWRISSLASELEEGMPGLGFPKWNVELLKVRNGKPGVWQMHWSNGAFHIHEPALSLMVQTLNRKVG